MEGNCTPKNQAAGRAQIFSPEADRSHWYVIHTYSRQEAKVESALQRNNLEIFLPRVTVPSRRRDRKRLLNVPLFPGYLFVHTDLNHHAYAHIIKNHGVVRILGYKGKCAAVPEETVASIKTLLKSGQPVYPYRYLKTGSRVRVLDGPLAGSIGVIMGRKEKKRRLIVSVELFQRAVAVELEDEAVERWS